MARLKYLAVILIALGLLAFGPAALWAIETAAASYGVAADSPEARAYLRAAAARDVALGIMLGGLLVQRATWRMLAMAILAIAMIAVADAAIVFFHDGWEAPAVRVHIGGAVVLLAAAAWLWSGREERVA